MLLSCQSPGWVRVLTGRGIFLRMVPTYRVVVNLTAAPTEEDFAEISRQLPRSRFPWIDRLLWRVSTEEHASHYAIGVYFRGWSAERVGHTFYSTLRTAVHKGASR